MSLLCSSRERANTEFTAFGRLIFRTHNREADVNGSVWTLSAAHSQGCSPAPGSRPSQGTFSPSRAAEANRISAGCWDLLCFPRPGFDPQGSCSVSLWWGSAAALVGAAALVRLWRGEWNQLELGLLLSVCDQCLVVLRALGTENWLWNAWRALLSCKPLIPIGQLPKYIHGQHNVSCCGGQGDEDGFTSIKGFVYVWFD